MATTTTTTTTRAPAPAPAPAPAIAAAPAPRARNKGPHDAAFMAQPRLPSDGTLQLVSAVCPWQPWAKGAKVWAVLHSMGGTATVQALVTAACAQHNFSVADVHGHLRWLYTSPAHTAQHNVWGKPYLTCNGALWGNGAVPPVPACYQPAAPAPAVAPAAPAPAKGKGKAKGSK